MIKKENHNRNIMLPVHLYILLENDTLYLRNAFPFAFLKCHSATGMAYIFCVYFNRSLMLVLLGYADAEVIVDHFYDRVITYWYSPHATWNLVEMSVGKTRYPQRLYFNLYLKRHPVFFVLNLILPICLMSILNFFVFSASSR